MFFSSQQVDSSRIQKIVDSTSDTKIHIIEGKSIAVGSDGIAHLKIVLFDLFEMGCMFGSCDQFIDSFLSDFL